MTAQSPTDPELLAECDETLADSCCEPLTSSRLVKWATRAQRLARALRSRLSPHLGPEWLEEIQKEHDLVAARKDIDHAQPILDLIELASTAHNHRATLLAHIRKATQPAGGLVSKPNDIDHKLGSEPASSISKATPGWREIDQDPPELGLTVLVLTRNGEIDVARRMDDGWWQKYMEYTIKNPVKWQLCPPSAEG